jgi:hypothetical protein
MRISNRSYCGEAKEKECKTWEELLSQLASLRQRIFAAYRENMKTVIARPIRRLTIDSCAEVTHCQK